jgi:hypothetical protein
MRYPKRSQYKYPKSPYRVRNLADYETALQRRGALTVWLSDTALEVWRAPAAGRPGGQRTYSGLAIGAALTIRMIFRLPLRQSEGFLRSLASLLGLGLPIPDHMTLSGRLWKLGRRNRYASSGYSRRSLVEDAVFRYKTVFGPAMRSRSLVGQLVEVGLACKILNTMTGLGVPDSVRVQ